MDLKSIRLEKDKGYEIITFNRPESLNALNKATLDELLYILEESEKDSSIEVLILTGEGKAFVAGADIKEMANMTADEARKLAQKGQAIFRKLELMEKVVIAAVNGFALGGGCELAMACDLRIASQKAKFGQPEVSLGVTPGFGGTQRLLRLIGITRAKELLLTGDHIDAEKALAYGLVNQVTPPEELMATVKGVVKKLLTKGPLSLKMVKSAVNRGISTDMDTGLAYEAQIFGLCFASGEAKEGMNAFVEKREAKFREGK